MLLAITEGLLFMAFEPPLLKGGLLGGGSDLTMMLAGWHQNVLKTHSIAVKLSYETWWRYISCYQTLFDPMTVVECL